MSAAARFTLRIRSRSRTKGKENQCNEVDTTNKDNTLVEKTKVISASARSMRKKRQLLKLDPVAWALHKEKEAERHRKQRRKRTVLQKEHDKVTAAVRSRKHYNKRKAEGESPQAKKARVQILTRAEKKSMTEYNREKQRNCRAKKTYQQKAWDRKKDREKKREKAAKQKLKSGVTTPVFNVSEQTLRTGYHTPSAERTAVSRIWKKMPNDAKQFAQIVSSFMNSNRLTPRKRNALRIRGLHADVCRKRLEFARGEAWAKLNGTFQCLKHRQNDKSREKRAIIMSSILVLKKYRTQRMIANDLGVRPNYLTKVIERNLTIQEGQKFRKKRADVKCIDVVNSIKDIYRSPLVSREIPTIRSVKKDLLPRRVMEVSISRAYEIWKSKTEVPDGDVAFTDVCSLSLFTKLRPDDVLLQHKHKLIQCLCEYCTDIMLKLQTLNRSKLKTLQIKDKYHLISSTLCPLEEGSRFHRLKCINRNCKDCGVELLRKKIAPLLVDHLPSIVEEEAEEEVDRSRPVTWKKWETVTYHHNQQTKSKKALQVKTGSLNEMVDDLLLEANPLAKHMFVANWQQSMFSSFSKTIPEGTVLLVLDFAENYSCFQQDEIQSAHWAMNQITIHPLVSYYNCPDHNGHHHVVQEAIVVISNDLKHDGHAVQHFVALTVDHLREKRGVAISKVVEFTDGCAGQYKCKSSFADISFSVQDLKVERDRHYFGSHHGKGPSDDGEINRDRQNRAVKTAVAGTRLIHAVKGVQPGVIGIRLLTCFCEGCQDNKTCVNSNFTQPWQRRALKLEIPQPSEDVEVRRSPKILEVGDGGQGEVEVGDIWQSFTKGVPVVPDDLTETELGDDDPLALMSLLEDVGLEIANENVPPANEMPTHHPATKESVVAVAASNHDNDVPTYLPDTEKSMNITPEKFYAVFYSDPPKWFIGRAMPPANDDGQMQMNFLEQKPDKGSRAYWWPKKRDEEKVPRHFIFYGPLNMSGHHLLMLTEDDDVEINSKFKCLKKIWN